MEVLTGRVTEVRPDALIVTVPYENTARACLRRYDVAQVGLPDGRAISPEQRRKASALIAEIADWMGEMPAYVKKLTKWEFVVERMDALTRKMFSLSDCDVTTAREYITYLIEFVIEHGVPTKVPLADLCEDIARYVYACATHKVCAVCGRKGEIHHVDRVGMGGDRKHMNHVGLRCLPLCRTHHSEAHEIGDEEFIGRYHLAFVEIDDAIVKINKLGKPKKAGNE